jgi:hypothetical protein
LWTLATCCTVATSFQDFCLANREMRRARSLIQFARRNTNRCTRWRCCNTCVHSLISCRFVDQDMLMRYHWGLGVGHLYTRIPGLAEPIPAGSPEQLVNDHTGDLHSIPEPDAPGGLAHHPQNKAPQPPLSPTTQLPKNATSAPEKAVSIRSSGI